MSWLTEMQDPSVLRDRASKSLNLPMGLTNPLWLAFGAAASAGAAWWLMTRWGRSRVPEAAPLAPVEAPPPATALVAPEPEAREPEAELSEAPPAADVLSDPVAPPAGESSLEPESRPEVAGAEALEPEALPEGAEHPFALGAALPEAAHEAQPEASAPPPPAPDDLTRLVGVGPRTAAALAKRGVTRFAQLAEWSAEEMAAFDAEMKLMGRSARNAWRDQARTLAGAP